MRYKSGWLALGLAVVAGAGYYAWRARPLVVSVVTPTRGEAVDAIYATGTVEPSVMLPIAPRVAARLAQLRVDEGDLVKKGQTLAQLDADDLDQSVAELDARARFAEQQYARTQELIRRGVAAAIDLDRAKADLDAARASLRRARAQRNFTTLVAPAAGRVIRRDGEVGQFIPAGQTIFYLECCAPLRVTAEVDEEDIPRVSVGQKVVMRADALPGVVMDGDVSEVTPKGDPVARSYRVRIRLLEPPAALRTGMTVDANLIVSRHASALLVPTTSLRDGHVWLLRDGRLQRQKVELGIRGELRTEVIAGLDDTARVVETPPDDATEGRRARTPRKAQKAP